MADKCLPLQNHQIISRLESLLSKKGGTLVKLLRRRTKIQRYRQVAKVYWSVTEMGLADALLL